MIFLPPVSTTPVVHLELRISPRSRKSRITCFFMCRMQKIKPPDPQNFNCNCTRNTYLSNYLFTQGYEHLPHVAVENKQKYKGELNVRFVRTEHIVNLVLKENIYWTRELQRYNMIISQDSVWKRTEKVFLTENFVFEPSTLSTTALLAGLQDVTCSSLCPLFWKIESTFSYVLFISDPWYFKTDPDPWISTLGYRSGSFWQWLSRCQKMIFLLIS